MESKFKISTTENDIDWNKYLNELHSYLTNLGFRKYNQDLKNEEFAYWKRYEDKYQIGLLVYDFRKYNQPALKMKVSIQFECMPLDIDCRCDLSVSKNIELPEFEKMSESFYNAMVNYIK